MIDTDLFPEEGLYLLLPDGSRIELTNRNIQEASERFWQDPSRITPEMKKAVDFQKCDFCPRKGKEDICDAIRPVLPFLDKLDTYLSYDEVTAVYRDGLEMLHVRKTTMQGALQYISLLSLLRYNMVLRKYWKYYYGVIPLMPAEEIARRVYLNMYWQLKADKTAIDREIAQFKHELHVSVQNQVKRLGLVCKNDVCINAAIKTHSVADYLDKDIEESITEAFKDHEQSYSHHF